MKVAERDVLKRQRRTHELIKEQDILFRLEHPNVIKICEFFRDSMQIGIVLEYHQTDLFTLVKKIGLPEKAARWYFAHVIAAVSYLHARHIIHRDLKCENILLSKQGQIQIIDFGTAKDLKNPQLCKVVDDLPVRREFKNYVGTVQFMAPECKLCKRLKGNNNPPVSTLTKALCKTPSQPTLLGFSPQITIGGKCGSYGSFGLLQHLNPFKSKIWCPLGQICPVENSMENTKSLFFAKQKIRSA